MANGERLSDSMGTAVSFWFSLNFSHLDDEYLSE